MTAFIEGLTSTLTPDGLWNALVGVSALIGTMVLFAFGYRVVRKLVKGVSKGKGTM